jgi:hypothetical protein
MLPWLPELPTTDEMQGSCRVVLFNCLIPISLILADAFSATALRCRNCGGPPAVQP